MSKPLLSRIAANADSVATEAMAMMRAEKTFKFVVIIDGMIETERPGGGAIYRKLR